MSHREGHVNTQRIFQRTWSILARLTLGHFCYSWLGILFLEQTGRVKREPNQMTHGTALIFTNFYWEFSLLQKQGQVLCAGWEAVNKTDVALARSETQDGSQPQHCRQTQVDMCSMMCADRIGYTQGMQGWFNDSRCILSLAIVIGQRGKAIWLFLSWHQHQISIW